MKTILKSSKQVIISILLLSLVIYSNLKFRRINKNYPQIRQLTSSSTSKQTDIELEINYINETIKCSNNSIFLPLIYSDFTKLTEISYSLNETEKKILSVCYTSENKKIYGIYLNDSGEFESNSITLYIKSNDTNLSSLFENNSIITDIKFSSSKIGDLKIISNMFRNCSNLKNVDFGGFTFDGITDVSNLFNNCINLEEIKFDEKSNMTEIKM